jgi:hypothetical protein
MPATVVSGIEAPEVFSQGPIPAGRPHPAAGRTGAVRGASLTLTKKLRSAAVLFVSPPCGGGVKSDQRAETSLASGVSGDAGAQPVGEVDFSNQGDLMPL